MARDPSVTIDLCCNDPDNGMFAGRVCQIALGDGLFSAYASSWNITSFRGCPRLRQIPGAIVLAGKAWPIRGRCEWHGNWCWNRYFLSDVVGARFMSWLHGRKLFEVDEAETRLFNLWQLDQSFTADDTAFIERLMAKAALHDCEMA